MPHRLRKPPRIWAPEASLRGSYRRFIHFLTPFMFILVMTRAQDRPSPLPSPSPRAAFSVIFVHVSWRKYRGLQGGIMSLEGVKFSKKHKLRTDLFHHTHEVWGPCSVKSTPLWRRGPRVLESYCGFPILRSHFSTLGHFHTWELCTIYWFFDPVCSRFPRYNHILDKFGVKIRCAAASGRGAYSTACNNKQ